MKRLRRIALALVLFTLLTFSIGCSSNNGNGKQENLATGVVSGDEKKTDDPNKGESKERETVEEQVLLDEKDIKITLKSLEFNGFFGPELKVLIENNSDKDITVQTRDSSVNDVMIETIFSSSVAPGKKANDSITFMSSELEEAEIHVLKNIEFRFHIFDSNAWEPILDSEIIVVNTISDSSYVQEYDDSGIVVLDEQGIKIVMKRVDSTNSFWGADVHVYIENNTDKDFTVQTRDESVNGFMMSPIFSSSVMSGKRIYSTITFMESDLVDNGIEKIEDMELSFHIFESNGWETILDTPKIEVTFE